MYEQIAIGIAETREEYEVIENRKGIIDRALAIMRKYQFNFEVMLKERTRRMLKSVENYSNRRRQR